MPSYMTSAPEVMKDQQAMDKFVAALDDASDLMTLANACAGIAWHALHEHLRREGKDHHVEAALEIVEYLEKRTAQLRGIWLHIEGKE